MSMSKVPPMTELARRLTAIRADAQAALDTLVLVTRQQIEMVGRLGQTTGEKGDMAARVAILESELRNEREKRERIERAYRERMGQIPKKGDRR